MKFYSILYVIFCLSTASMGQEPYSIIIDEIMVDPSPANGLPGNEWIELRNTSNHRVNLKGWRIGDLSGESGPMGEFELDPDSFVILCPASAMPVMAGFGKTLSVSSFPSFDNEGDLIYLMNAQGATVHALRYNSSWYNNEMKKEGGWSLEMIDTHHPCNGPPNWIFSIAVVGGSPGIKNSVDDINADESPPTLLNAFAINEHTLRIRFNEPVDRLMAAATGHYLSDGGLEVVAAIPIAPMFDEVELELGNEMKQGMIYNVDVKDISDCSGNPIAASSVVRTGLPDDPQKQDLVINEILFNPRSPGFDYIELYNNGHKIVDAGKLFIANRNNTGALNSIKSLSQLPLYIFPGDFVVITEDAAMLQRQYLVQYPEKILVLPSMPSFPDDAGYAVLLNGQGEIIDEVSYRDDWHFKLIDDPQGVALERMDPTAASEDPANWHSAASTAGYGTPTYKNSQFFEAQASTGSITINPKMFSPDNDGHADIAIIKYLVKEAGFVANIVIYDHLGRPVRNLIRNGTLALTGYWNWDGLNDKGLRLPVGPYIILTELFNLQGKKERFKNVVVLSRKL